MNKDHPRACGEKIVLAYLPVAIPGSPPRVRGKGVAVHDPFAHIGITPARAGKRLSQNGKLDPP